MLNKLLNFASSLLKQESSDTPSKQEQASSTDQRNASSPMDRSHPNRHHQAPETFNIIEFSSDSNPPPPAELEHDTIAHIRPHQTLSVPTSLDDLYQTLSLEAGMIYIADTLANSGVDTYVSDTDLWLKQSNFQTLGTSAIASKRQGHYGDAMMIFNELAQQCPYYYQIHSSAMKILAASGNVDAALRAAQLWCIAIIPEKVLRLGRDNIHEPWKTQHNPQVLQEQMSYLAGWAIADSKVMYHLGSLHMLTSGEFTPATQEAYLATLQGKSKQALHNPKEAVRKGKEVAQDLPWGCLLPVMETELWQTIFHRSTQHAQKIMQERSAA